MSAPEQRGGVDAGAGIEIVRLGGNIGAEIRGVDLRRPLDRRAVRRDPRRASCATR